MKVPNHIAIILDGNGRWAKAKGMPRGYGHIKGCANLENICDDIKDLEDSVQKLTDKFIKKIDAAVDTKAKEILTV